MRSRILGTLKKIDDALEVIVFDWALHPSRRRRTLALCGLAGMAAGYAMFGGARPQLSPQEHLAEGMRLLPRRAKAVAATAHLEAASRAIDESRVWASLGHAYLNSDRAHEGVRAYQRAVEKDASTNNLFFLGYGYIKAELPEVALGVYQQIRSKNAFFYPALAYEGVAHDKAGRYQVALARFRQALAYNPNYVPGHFHMGITFVNTKEYDKSIRCFEKVIELDPTESAAYYNIACCYSLMGEADKALEWLALSVERGFHDWKHMEKDTDLDNIRKTARYATLRDQARVAWEADVARD